MGLQRVAGLATPDASGRATNRMSNNMIERANNDEHAPTDGQPSQSTESVHPRDPRAHRLISMDAWVALSVRIPAEVKAALERAALEEKHRRGVGRFTIADLLKERYRRLLPGDDVADGAQIAPDDSC